MGSHDSLKGLKNYEDVVIEVYCAEKVENQLLDLLQQELGDSYNQKYTRSSEREKPMLSIQMDDEIDLLFGNNITLDNINKLLDDRH